MAFLRIGAFCVAAVPAAALASGVADGQPAHFNKPPLTYFPASEIIQIPAGDMVTANLSGMKFQRLPTIPKGAEASLKKNGFELRFFRIDRPGALPVPWKKSLDDCDVYLSVVIKGPKFNGSSAVTGPMDHSWLARGAGGYETDGVFRLVFEEMTPDDNHKTGRWEIFRINHKAASQYFQNGVDVQIAAPYGAGTGILYTDIEGQVRKLLDSFAAEIATKYNCYAVQSVEAVADGARYALDRCNAQPPAAPEADVDTMRTPALAAIVTASAPELGMGQHLVTAVSIFEHKPDY